MNINVIKNKFEFDLEDLMVLANRANNPKRNFLFVSKLLGKHIEVNPNVCRATGKLLASLLYSNSSVNVESLVNLIKGEKVDNEVVLEELNKSIQTEDKNFILGFAETATGLGMAVASSISNSHYQITTREPIVEIKNMLSFEEEHSHATNHKCFTLYQDKIKEADRIILVDDEITTGNSMRNLIRELVKITDVQEFVILSILDWRSQADIEKMYKLQEELKVSIDVLSLLSGAFSTEDKSVYVDETAAKITTKTAIKKLDVLDRIEVETDNGLKDYYIHSGRFGVNHNHIEKLEFQCKRVANLINKDLTDDLNVLVLGHGEDIYIPSRVAAYVKGNVKFKTTTRSPILCKEETNYPIKSKHSFEHEGVEYFLYNKKEMESKYDKVILLVEDNLDVKLTENITIIRL